MVAGCHPGRCSFRIVRRVARPIGRALLGVFLATGWAVPANSTEPMVTDRPDTTESPVVLPVGLLQLEFGASAERQASGAETVSIGEALLRFGWLDRLELRFSACQLGSESLGRALPFKGSGISKWVSRCSFSAARWGVLRTAPIGPSSWRPQRRREREAFLEKPGNRKRFLRTVGISATAARSALTWARRS